MKTKSIFGLLALIAVSLGVYAIYKGSGNINSTNANATQIASTGEKCSQSTEQSKSLKPLIHGEIAAFRTVEDPVDLSGLMFNDVNGEAKTIADWNNKTVLLNIWATWCPPCREEMPHLQKLHSEKGSDAFDVVAVSIDQGNPLKPTLFYKETKLDSLPFYHDGSTQIFQHLRKTSLAVGTPVTVLIDGQGCAIGVINGPANWASKEAIKLIESSMALPIAG